MLERDHCCLVPRLRLLVADGGCLAHCFHLFLVMYVGDVCGFELWCKGSLFHFANAIL